MEGLAGALAAAGFATATPLLPGHGTTVDDLETRRWPDWVAAAGEAFDALAARAHPVMVAGLSMGGALACRLAADPGREVAGLVAVNPFVDPPAPSFREALGAMLDQGFTRVPGIGGDAADPAAEPEGAYDKLPIEPLLSLCDGLDDLKGRLASITAPVLLLTSRVDHVVPTVSSDLLAAGVSGPVERVWLERSFHLATLDHDRGEVERRVVEFARKVVAT